ncbi:ATP-binding protein [Thalassotalea euphylliae]|uniref:ATP-binding protein n=1 Tax=Thalassotalea euphylliae TaxID=1655234 RepID=UPI00363E9B73
MSTFMRLVTLICLLIVTQPSFAETDLTAEEQNWLSNKKTLVTAYPSFEYLPYIIQSSDGKILGIFNDYLKLVSSELGLSIEYRIYSTSKEMEEAFARKEIDIIVGFADLERRKAFMSFTDPFISVPRSILVPKHINSNSIDSIQAFNNYVFAIEEGFASRTELKQHLPDIQFFDVNGTPEAMSAIKFGLAQAYYGDWITNNYIYDKAKNSDLNLVALNDVPEDRSQFAVQPDQPLLKSAINKVIQNIAPTTKAFIAARWNSSNAIQNNSRVPLILTPTESDWLARNDTIRYAYSEKWRPFTQVNLDGKPIGIAVEILEAIAERLGLDLEPVYVENWRQGEQFLANDKVDLLPGMVNTQFLDDDILLSRSYHMSPWVLIARSNSRVKTSQDAKTARIAIPNIEGVRVTIGEQFPVADIVVLRDMEHALQMLDEGEADAFFILLSSVAPLLQDENLGRYHILTSPSAEKNIHVSFGIGSDNATLHSLINKGLAELGSKEIRRINNHWSQLNIQQGIDISKIITFAVIPVMIGIVILCGILFWNRKLQAEIKSRTAAEQRAKQAEFELNSLADAIPGAVLQFKLNTKQHLEFTYVSQGIEDLGPLSQNALLKDARNFFAAIPKEDLERLKVLREETINTLGPVDIEFRVIVDQGAVNWLHFAAFPEKLGDETLWNGVLLKVNERKEQEFALSKAKVAAEQAAIAKSRFLAMMSHEIRTPIGGIIGMLELLEQSSLTESQHHDLKTIASSANNLLHILNDVLDHSKLEAGQLTVENIDANLPDLVESAMLTHANNAHNKGIGLKLEFDPTIYHGIKTDPIRLQQVLSNLLSNAIKFTEKGEVKLMVERTQANSKQQTLRFAITDTGIGISPTNLRKLFSPFAQAEDSTSRKYGGTGLGLTICKMLVERLGGSIDVDSTLGQGTTFSFSLTLETDEQPFVPEIKRKLPIVLIDDMSFACSKIKRYFNAWGVPLVVLPFGGDTDHLKSLLPSGKCVFICPEELISHYQLAQINTVSSWINLSKRSFSPEPGQHFISINPLLITSLISGVNKAQQDRDTDLMMLIDKDEKQASGKMTREEAIASGRLILVAEDHPTNQMVIKRQLEKLNYHADIVDDGKQALDAIYQQSYGLLITDCHMPNMDGYDLTKTLRAQGNPIPIVALTANALTGEADHCLEMGMNDYLTKPTSMDVLQTTVEKYLNSDIDNSFVSVEANNFDDLAIFDFDHITTNDDGLKNVQAEADEVIDAQDIVQFPSDVRENINVDSVKGDYVNMQTLVDMFGDQEMVFELIQQFIDTTRESIKDIGLAIEAENIEEVGLVAHRIKGGASMITAHGIEGCAAILEKSAKANKKDELDTLFADLTAHADRFVTQHQTASLKAD